MATNELLHLIQERIKQAATAPAIKADSDSSGLNQPMPMPIPVRGYLLVDGAQREAIIRQYFLLDETPEYRPLFLGLGDDGPDTLAASPYLMELHEGSGNYLNWLAAEHPELGFAFLSANSLDQQLPFWQSLLTVRYPDGAAGYFRFFDGRVARRIFFHGTDGEKQKLFQPCHALFFQDEQSRWHGYDNPYQTAEIENQLSGQVTGPWLTLSQSTVAKLTRAGHESRQAIRNFLWQHYPRQLHEMTHEELQNLLARAESRCNDYDIAGWKYRVLFHCLMVECGPAFDHHPSVAQIFRQEQISGNSAWGERALERLSTELLRPAQGNISG